MHRQSIPESPVHLMILKGEEGTTAPFSYSHLCTPLRPHYLKYCPLFLLTLVHTSPSTLPYILPPFLTHTCGTRFLSTQVSTSEEARTCLSEMEAVLRAASARCSNANAAGSHTACADLLRLHAATHTWISAERHYKSAWGVWGVL